MKNIIQQKTALFLAVALTSLMSNAQDVHFSQMEFSPLTLNPALAGANSPAQGILNYRSQWNSVAVPYQTIAASFDGRFNNNKRGKKGILAGGINFFNDQAGNLKVTTNSVNVSLAYHLILDKTSTLGVGINTGFGQRSISASAGRWGNQYDGTAYNNTFASGETFSNASFSFIDAGAGMVYAYKQNSGYKSQTDQKAVNVGFAVYHLNKPSYSYLNDNAEKLNMRISVFANANISISGTKGAVLPGIYFQKQGSSTELLFGAYYKYLLSKGSMATGFSKPTSLSFGLFNRLKDALVAKLMLDWGNYSTGFAYDLNISSLNDVSRAKGGFEVFLRFNMTDNGNGNSRF